MGFERGRNLPGDCGRGGTRAAAAVTRCLTALRKRPGQPPASAQRLRLQRLRAARPPLPRVPRCVQEAAGGRRGRDGRLRAAGWPGRAPGGVAAAAAGCHVAGAGPGAPGLWRRPPWGICRTAQAARAAPGGCLPPLIACPRSSAPCLHPGVPNPFRFPAALNSGQLAIPARCLIPAPSFSRVREAWHTRRTHSFLPPPTSIPNPH